VGVNRRNTTERTGRIVRRVCLCLAAALFVLLAVTSPALAFTDVGQKHVQLPAITDLNQRKVIEGYDDGTFRPEAQVRRQHFAKMIVLSIGFVVSETDVCTFRDVPKGGPEDFYPDNYIAVCAENGITQGYDGTLTGRFGPLDNIRRTQLVTMVVRAAENFGNVNLAEPNQWYFEEGGALASFSDKDHGHNVHVAEFNGLLYSIGWKPADMYDYATRGEVAQILYNFIRVCQIRAAYVNVGGGGDFPTLHAAAAGVAPNSVVVLGPGPDVIVSAMGIVFEHTGTVAGDVAVVTDAVYDFYRCNFQGGVYNPGTNSGGDGIWIRGTSAGIVADCLAADNEYCGIDVSGGAWAVLFRNWCSLNDRHGIMFGDKAEGWLILNAS